MGEEAKKVVLRLNEFIYGVDNKYKLEITNSKILKDILNLIEKQQKEIKLIKELNLQDNRTLKMQGEVLEMYKNNFISKDKIKDILKNTKKDH